MNINSILTLLNIPRQWQKTKGAGVKVAMIDQPCHLSRVPFIKAVNYDPSIDNHYHGSIVAWIINQVAPEAEIFSLKGLKGWPLAECLEWCITNNIDIINISASLINSEKAKEMLDKASEAGIIIVASAGNSSYDPSDNDSEVTFPADYPTVIAVASLQKLDKIASDSSGGPEVFTSAPGVLDGLPWSPWNASGTSFAAPFITGSLALIKSIYPSLTIDQAKKFIQENSKDILIDGRDERSGYGMFVFPNSGENKGAKENKPLAPQTSSVVKILVNGQIVEGILINDKTYASVRAVAEALGYKVDWAGATQTVIITK